VTKPDGKRDLAIERMLRETLEARAASTGQGQCLDADMLAAWADDQLPLGERSRVEAHAADCARCQMLLAAMARTGPSPAEASTSWWRLNRIGWLVPLAGVGAAVIVWTLAPGPPKVQPGLSAPPVDAVVEAPVAPGSNLPARSERAQGFEPPPAEGRLRASTDKSLSPSSTDNAAKLETAPASEGARVDRFVAQAPAPAAAPQSAPESPASSVVAAPEILSARARAGAGDTMIVSSNPGSRWRIVPDGAVQRSSDGGATWQTQQTGVSVTLVAGASPSPSVCWLVGPGGIVVLSTDGRSWRRVAFPEETDLVTVQATDGKTATVTSVDGRAFTTDNGGVTWTRAPVQDFPAPPF
jgi:hypothetical protein